MCNAEYQKNLIPYSINNILKSIFRTRKRIISRVVTFLKKDISLRIQTMTTEIKEITVHSRAFELYLSASEISDRIDELAATISEMYRDKCPTFLMVLKGAFMFGTELIKRFPGPCEVAFVKAKSYVGMASTGELQIDSHHSLDLKGKHVILIEDIVDSGNTLSKLIPMLQELNPANIELATLLFKPEALQQPIEISYCGFEIPNRFVVGFGLDYDQLGRNYPAIYALKD